MKLLKFLVVSVIMVNIQIAIASPEPRLCTRTGTINDGKGGCMMMEIPKVYDISAIPDNLPKVAKKVVAKKKGSWEPFLIF